MCPICHDEWNADGNEVVRTPCQHTYHKTCLLEWIDAQDDRVNKCTCPMDRQLLCYSKTASMWILRKETADWYLIRLLAQASVDLQLPRLEDADGLTAAVDPTMQYLKTAWRAIPHDPEGDGSWLDDDDTMKCLVLRHFMNWYRGRMGLHQWMELGNLRRQILERTSTMSLMTKGYLWIEADRYHFRPEVHFQRDKPPRFVCFVLRNNEGVAHPSSVHNVTYPFPGVLIFHEESHPNQTYGTRYAFTRLRMATDRADGMAGIDIVQLGPGWFKHVKYSIRSTSVKLRDTRGWTFRMRFKF
jgi:hypothetical protein